MQNAFHFILDEAVPRLIMAGAPARSRIRGWTTIRHFSRLKETQFKRAVEMAATIYHDAYRSVQARRIMRIAASSGGGAAVAGGLSYLHFAGPLDFTPYASGMVACVFVSGFAVQQAWGAFKDSRQIQAKQMITGPDIKNIRIHADEDKAVFRRAVSMLDKQMERRAGIFNSRREQKLPPAKEAGEKHFRRDFWHLRHQSFGLF